MLPSLLLMSSAFAKRARAPCAVSNVLPVMMSSDTDQPASKNLWHLSLLPPTHQHPIRTRYTFVQAPTGCNPIPCRLPANAQPCERAPATANPSQFRHLLEVVPAVFPFLAHDGFSWTSISGMVFSFSFSFFFSFFFSNVVQ